MLTQEDKNWIVQVLQENLKTERSITNQQFAEMREFIIEGRREDRAWVREELTQLRAWTEKKIDSSIEQFAIVVNSGFVEVHERMYKLETQKNWS